VPQHIHDVFAVQFIARAHRFGGLQRPASGEHSKSLEQPPLGCAQQVVAPIEGRGQGLVARRGGATDAAQQPEALVEPRGDLFGCERFDSRRRKLERQRKTVKATADLNHSRCIAAGQREIGPDRRRTLNEELNGWIPQQFVRMGRPLGYR
jgi:hypothetical protein